MNRKFLLTALFPLLFACSALAQPKRITLSGQIRNQTGYSVTGAVVEVISEQDTLRGTSSMFGTFIVRKVKEGDAQVRVTHLSYKPYEMTFRLSAKENKPLEIELELDVKQIESVAVKAAVPLYKRSGDTLIYNAAAVKTLDGDEAIRVLEQLPGIIVDGKSLKAMGREVMRTYVDGRLVFGDDPMAALLNLTADDVHKIRIYDEYSAYDKRHKRRNARKYRVLDIETKSRLISATTGHLLAGYGADFSRDADGRHQERYGAGATANFFSERLRLSGTAYTNNVNRTSNRLDNILNIKGTNLPYSEQSHAGIGYAQQFGPTKDVSPELSADYAYKNTYTRNASINARQYFPTSEYTTRNSADSLRTTARSEQHYGRLNFSWGTFYLHQDFSIDRMRSESRHRQRSVLDERLTTTASDNRSRTHNKRYSTSFGWLGEVTKRLQLQVYGDFDLGWSDGTSFREDSLSSRPLKEAYRSTPIGRTRQANGVIEMVRHLNKGLLSGIMLGYHVRYRYDKSRLMRYDLVQGELDVPASRDFTYDYLTHAPQFRIHADRGKHSAHLTLPLEIATMQRTEAFPTEERGRRSFTSWVPRFNYTYRGASTEVECSYRIATTLPSLEQLSARIADSNPLYVSAGNPALKQTETHELDLNVQIIDQKGGTLTGSLFAGFARNTIAGRTRFYKEGATLPDYNGYVIPAGGTFTTYDNIDGYRTCRIYLGYNGRLQFIRSRLHVSFNGNYTCYPSYVGDEKNRTRTYSPSIRVGLTSGFSKKVRLKLASNNTLIYNRNDVGDNYRYFRETVQGSIESNFAKRLFANAVYEYNLYKPIGGSNGRRDERHMLNAVVGCKFHKNMGAVSLLCYDLLDVGAAFKTIMKADYVQDNWASSFGRYWMINVSYKFNKKRAGTQAPRVTLDDGSDPNRLF